MTLRKSSVLACVAGLVALAGAANAASFAQLIVDGGDPIAIPLEDDGKADYYCAGTPGCSNPALSGADWTVKVDVFLDPDPFIQYGVAVTNSSGGALSFGFLFSQSITLTPTPGTVNTSISGSTTNGGGVNGVVTITPLAPPGLTPVDSDGNTEIQVFNLSSDGGTTLTNATIDLGQPFSSNGGQTSDTYPAENSAIIAGPLGSGSYDFMRVDLNFSQSGGGDVFTFNGSARVVPEPGTAALFGLGLLGLGYVGRRRS
jgi:hypothetical protein